jgi:hypothetical protein
MKTCQIIILCLFVLSFFYGLWVDFHGRPARQPLGFPGAVITVVVTTLFILLYWKAGTFSLLF